MDAASINIAGNITKQKKVKPTWTYKRKMIKRRWQLYLLLVLPVIWLIIFRYIPMYGLQIAFRNYMFVYGFSRSPWVGLQHFRNFINSHHFSRLIGNTVGISLFTMLFSFFPPIILAIALNECRIRYYQKTVQMITYAPYFLSTVVVVSMLLQIFSIHGVVNTLINMAGGSRVSFISNARFFRPLFVGSIVWQMTGYNSIIYIAALAGINPELQEAAEIDGANIWQRIWNVDIPGIMPTAIILLILSSASILSVGFERVYLMQNPLNMPRSDVIATFVYRVGLLNMDFSFATAVGLFQSVISLTFLLIVNMIAKRVSEISLF